MQLFTFALFLIFLTFFSYPSLGGQISRVAESSISRHIYQPTITAILKDRRGFLWVGTQHGLYKHDGSKLIIFNSEQSGKNWIPVSDIRGIAEDHQGNVLIATFGGGMLKWNDETLSFGGFPISDSRDAKYLTNLIHSHQSGVWVTGKAGLYLYSDKNLSNPNSKMLNELAKEKGKVGAIISDNIGNVYFSSGSNIYRFSSHENSLEKINWNLTNPSEHLANINAMALGHSDWLYIGTDDGNIFGININDFSIFAKEYIGRENSASISKMLFFNNTLWVGTTNGLYQFSERLNKKALFNHNNSALSNDYITALEKDDNFLWVGTFQGLHTVSQVSFRTFNEENSSISEDVLSFAQDIQDRIWIGTFNGLYLHDSSTGINRDFESLNRSYPLVDQRVMTIAAKYSDLWFGFQRKGVQILNIETGKVTTPEIPQADNLEVTKILHTRDERTWLATYNRGVYSINGDVVTSYLDEGSLPESSVTILFELESGTLLASTERNIYQYDKKLERFDILDLKFSDNNQPPLILSLSQSRTGDIWLGTKDQGLFIWPIEHQRTNNHDLLTVYADSEMPSFTIYAIQFDRQGNAWCSTQQGIIKLDNNGKLIARFTSADGLQGNDFNFGASFIDSQGRMYFGGSHGYSRFNPEEVGVQTSAPRLLLNNIEISRDGDTFSYVATELEALELSHRDQHIRFEFGVLDFLDPYKNLYRYKVEGMDRNWIDNGTRNVANYSDFPPGDYLLKVQGANSAGVWNRTGLSLNIHVAPPPWQTWWAYSFYAVITAFMLWLSKRAYDSYEIERRAAELAVEMHEAAEIADDDIQEQLEIRDDFVKSVYRHNVDTLTLINDSISAQSATFTDLTIRKIVGATSKRVEALALLEDCIYQQNELLLADLNKFTDIIIARLLEDSPIRKEAITSINEVSSKLLPIEFASPLAIALHELLENSIQHAFRSESSANYIHVIFTCEQPAELGKTRYRLTVEDNGQGFPSHVDAKAGETTGLAIIHAMAERLSGSLEVNSEKGTSVSLVFICSEVG